MAVQGIGACILLAMMRLERRAELDSSWLLHGPGFDDEAGQEEEPAAWRYAAE